MPRSLRVLPLTALLALTLGLAACGGEDTESGTKEQGTAEGTPTEGKQGGKLVMLASDDVDFIDPGITYYQFGFTFALATQKPLYNWKPDDSETPVPDLAEGEPEISDDAKTVTVKIKSGVKFSPPVDREVTSADVKYGIERGFFESVANGYAGVYYGDIVGAKPGVKAGTKIEGIETPDATTIVFKLAKPVGGVLAGALALPLSAPVPEEYAKEFDAKSPSEYGANQVATGPYMVENDASGKAIGYEAGKRIHLVRNPNWDKSKGFQPAYLDEIDVQEGNNDTTVASRRILTGSALVNGDFAPPPPILKSALTSNKDQLVLVGAGGTRYISMNTTVKPFDDINVRKGVVAGFDREAMRLARGGEIVGDIPTHLIPPGIPGFDESGGAKGFGLDFMNAPKGDLALAGEYFKKAGYASGKYEGTEELLMVGSADGVAQKAAETAKENFEKLGFKVRLRLVTQDAMYTKFCNVPKAKVAICPNTGWFKDFADPQTILDPTFNGENILPTGNSNWPQLNVPEINTAMNAAAELTDPGERATAWAAINRQVTEQAPVIPWIWDKDPSIRSKDVVGVVNSFNASWDVAFSSLK